MSGYARIIKNQDAIYVRFEQVGNQSRFSIVRSEFNKMFHLKDWEETERAWRLVPAELPRIVTFSINVFGPTGYIIQRID